MRSIASKAAAMAAGALSALLWIVSTIPAAAGPYPERPIALVVPMAAGGNVDLTSRIVAERLEKILGQPIAIENRTGAGGSIGTNYGARAAPDGYTLVIGSNGPITVWPEISSKVPYDPKSFEPIGLLSRVPMVVSVSPSFPPQNLAELIAYAKQNPGKIRGASGGIATSTHVALEQFNVAAGVKIRHIPYNGGQSALFSDLFGGHIDLTFDQITTSAAFAGKGQVRILGITSATRSPLLPDTPTLDEAGLKGFRAASYVCLLAPPGTPKEIIATVSEALKKTLDDPEVRAKLEKLGAQVESPSPEKLAAFLREETARMKEVVAATGLKVD